MANAKTTEVDSEIATRPKYYEVYGAEIANGNRAWVLGGLMSLIALVSLVFAIVVRLQPPTVIRIGPKGEATIVGRPTKGGSMSAVTAGTDDFLNQAFLKRFLRGYLNYTASNVDERWTLSLNMMTRNLRGLTMKKMKDDNTRQKIDDEQIQSTFHLREVSEVPEEPLTFVVYGVKDVHHLKDGSETTDHFVNEYRVRLIADRRTEVNPDGLWVAEYSERSIDGERRDQVLAAPDQEPTDPSDQ
jgi:VirB8 protein